LFELAPDVGDDRDAGRLAPDTILAARHMLGA